MKKNLLVSIIVIVALSGCHGSGPKGTGNASEKLTVDTLNVADCDGIASKVKDLSAKLEPLSTEFSYCGIVKKGLADVIKWLNEIKEKAEVVCPNYYLLKTKSEAFYESLALYVEMEFLSVNDPMFAAAKMEIIFAAAFKCDPTSEPIAKGIFIEAMTKFFMANKDNLFCSFIDVNDIKKYLTRAFVDPAYQESVAEITGFKGENVDCDVLESQL